MAKVIESEIKIAEIKQASATFCIVGNSPLIMERMSEKVKGELLLPKGKKTAADKATSLKHNPLQEYRDSAYQFIGDNNPTRLMMRSTAFKGAMSNAALDLPGAKKSQIGRLAYVPGEYVDIYGEPRMLMSVVRSSDMNRTPDIRTRCIVPFWACVVTVNFISPQLRQQSIANLLAAAGAYIGVGGWRPQKGSGSYGQFEIVSEDDERFIERTKIGMEDQDRLLSIPKLYDKESEDLYQWYNEQINERGLKVVA